MLVHASNTVSKFGKDQTGKVNYSFNCHGFRGPDFDFIPKYAFFGCSLVFGVGVDQSQTFPYLFENSQNYGLAGNYTDHDTMIVIEKFLLSDLYSPGTKMVIVWRSQDQDILKNFYQRLNGHNFLHFFCGQPLNNNDCYATPPNIDYDVSETHYGPASHRRLCKTLQNLFRL